MAFVGVTRPLDFHYISTNDHRSQGGRSELIVINGVTMNPYKVGPVPVISGVRTPLSRVTTLVTHL